MSRSKSGEQERLRVALIAGGLGKGGAEKQLTYVARALHLANVDLRVYCLSRGEFYESAIRDEGIPLRWVGRFGNPLLRLSSIVRALRSFRPHIVQATHFYTNLYAAAAGAVYRAVSIGAIRSDARYEMEMNKLFGRSLFRSPVGLIANSMTAMENAAAMGLSGDRISYLPNVIDLAEFDSQAGPAFGAERADGPVIAISVGNFFPKKRFDLFLRALAKVRTDHQCVRGVVVGDGPKGGELKSLAGSLGLLPEGVTFAGRRDDVPLMMRKADMLVLPSDHEGFPNVVLEAMAARLPVIATPAGDAGRVVQDGVTGYVVPFNSDGAIADRIGRLAASRENRLALGVAGRKRVEEQYSFEVLARRLLDIYSSLADRHRKTDLARVLNKRHQATKWSDA